MTIKSLTITILVLGVCSSQRTDAYYDLPIKETWEQFKEESKDPIGTLKSEPGVLYGTLAGLGGSMAFLALWKYLSSKKTPVMIQIGDDMQTIKLPWYSRFWNWITRKPRHMTLQEQQVLMQTQEENK